MEIKNLSTRYKTEDLQGVLAYVRKMTPTSLPVQILIHDQDLGMGRGKAYLRSPLGGGGPLVQIWLGRPQNFPHTSRAVPTLRQVHVTNWREALVLLLTHELSHINQFINETFVEGQEIEAEEAAESWARKILSYYRRDAVCYGS